eukprot:m.37483 g.37483  ORF g.37483 m.37483 type:complete len:76 (-) comp10100_c0_seq1:627-854(-)
MVLENQWNCMTLQSDNEQLKKQLTHQTNRTKTQATTDQRIQCKGQGDDHDHALFHALFRGHACSKTEGSFSFPSL